MKNILLEKNEVLMESIDLPMDCGETCASESMHPLNDLNQSNFITKIKEDMFEIILNPT